MPSQAKDPGSERIRSFGVEAGHIISEILDFVLSNNRVRSGLPLLLSIAYV
jgi:hypothetical protein